MTRFEIITGILSYIGLALLSSGVGGILMYNRGDSLSLSITFLTIFCSSFFISGIKNQTSFDMILKDTFLGICGVLFAGAVFLGGSYESLAVVAPMAIFLIIIFKLK